VRKNAERVKVRGVCGNGHVTEAFAPRRRTTWTGPCSDEHCDLSVVCRRVPQLGGPAEESKPVTLPSGVKVRRVAGYERSKRPSPRAGLAEPVAGGAGEAEPDPPRAPVDERAGGDPGFAEGREREPEYWDDPVFEELGI
jgi:hypothetical protein